MDYSDSHNKPNTNLQEHDPQKHRQPSNSELMASAKLVAEAAQSTLSQENDKVDKGRVAGAAEDLLDAASRYGKLEEKSYGNYVEKAETYLHQYHSSHSSTTSTDSGHSATQTADSAPPSGDDGQSGSGYGDYLKMAEGFLKKR
ncbi:hypothetical protein I3843_05G117400 [Carya illinoinensis]|uniref:Nodulin-related protein 1 n=1 Tax=Carya illinoinensis TaxID=32201 RepID=A0A8T1QIQ6_CARIL|nr:nodulin-related protein 1-like [Carya illinoinensis]KAG2707033.1 hypothetical protein I3760_05G129100 [Carya illinoinensis]KAG6654189.1 hypothetical protein CIPAW_05G127600 [Carya illinoinensis]KAG6712923.1 hypothetical protein I3842_05G124800 [Carya illinoinensis]KAG7979177.1 hypothetical protein I3843_05G117400 [Carya illinoinensis]